MLAPTKTVPCEDFQDQGHIRHPYRDYVEGKESNDSDIRTQGTGKWIQMVPGRVSVSEVPEKLHIGEVRKEGGPEDAVTS